MCLLITTVVLLVHTQSWFIGTAALMIALVCLLPLLFDIAVFLFDRFQERFLDGPATVLAVTELRNPRTRIRSLAVALTGAIAVFGTVAIGGAQVNLRHGLQASAGDIDSGAQIWVSPRSQTSLLTTTPFQAIDTNTISRAAGVAAVGVYRGSFLDWEKRRLWILAPPTNSPQASPQANSSRRTSPSPTRESGPEDGRFSLERSPPNTTYRWGAASCFPHRSPHRFG